MSNNSPSLHVVMPTTSFGGHERMLLMWLSTLTMRRSCIEAIIHCQKNADLITECERRRLPFLVAFSHSTSRMSRLLSIYSTFRVIREIPRNSIILLSPGVIQHNLLHILIAKILGRKVICYTPMAFSSETMGFRLPKVKDIFARQLIKIPTAWITISNIQSQLIKNFWGFRGQVHVIPNWVDIVDHSFFQKKRVPDNRLNVLFLGRFDANQKGLDWLINVLSHHQTRWKGVMRFTFQGSGPFLDRLEVFAQAHGANHVQMKSWGNSEDALAHADVLILTSRFEGMPLVALEAIQCGIAIAASQESGLSDLLPSTSLFPFGDIDSFFRALESLTDDSKREDCVRHGKQQLAASFSKGAYLTAVDFVQNILVEVNN